MGRKAKYDWEEIKREYECGIPQSEIIINHGCDKGTLSKKIKTENWEINQQASAYMSKQTEINQQINQLNQQQLGNNQIASYLTPELLITANKIADEKARIKTKVNNASEMLLDLNISFMQRGYINKPVKMKNGDYDVIEQVPHELTPIDGKNIADSIDRASITANINERHAKPTQIDNTNAQQNNTPTQIVIKRDN